MRARGAALVQPSQHLLLHLVLHVLLHLLQPAAPAAVQHADTALAVAAQQSDAAAMEAVSVDRSPRARDLNDSKQTSVGEGAATGTGPRRRQQWDFVGPSLLLGGTLTALMLAAIGHLASKALLASMLSAALSAVQLARPPPPNRPG